MVGYKTYRDMEVWLKAKALTKEIYLLTKIFPKDELYGLVSQIRRCAVSIPSNIAEGYGRQHKKETIQFLHIARGSLYELETQLYISKDLEYIDESKINSMILMIDECRKILNGLINYFENNNNLK
ncbi:MAG TPA: four helix bundle protein [Chitinophagaceae bacterium]|nr:four helix bundle protein [Chitinophagaceae bacterium]